MAIERDRLSKYIERTHGVRLSDRYLPGTPRARVADFGTMPSSREQIEREELALIERQRFVREQERLIAERQQAAVAEFQRQWEAAQAAGSALQNGAQEDKPGVLERTGQTVLDLVGNLLTGVAKHLEGATDFAIGAVGWVGSLFDEDFGKDVKDVVNYDAAWEWVGKHFDSWTPDSYTENGGIPESIAHGIGYILPSVIVSIISHGAAAPVFFSQFAPAAGVAAEEAMQEGAGYAEAMGYGAVMGGVEYATNKVMGGADTVAGYFDDVLRTSGGKTAATGLKRAALSMAGEAAEEGLSELATPLAKTIYKGRDALDEYGEAEYWQGVGQSAIVGGLTDATFAGTAGRILHTSGKYADVRETMDDIKATEAKRQRLHIDGKLTDAREADLHRRVVADYRQIEKILQKATPKQRARMMAQNGLDGAFDADGSLTADFLRSLGENVVDGQMDTQGENTQGEGISADESVQFRFEDGKDQADEDLVEFYQSVLAMSNPQRASKRKQGLGQVSPAHAALIADIIKKETGKQIDVSDFEIIMDGSAVNHIEDRHGKNGKADHSMEDEANIARIPWAMNNATQAEILRDKDGNFDLDAAYKNSDGTSSYKVRLERPIGNDRFYVVECVPDSARKQLIVKSAYIEKGSRGQVVTREADGSPYPTSETFRADATDNSIPQKSELSTGSGEKVAENFDHRYMSPDLWRRTEVVDREIEKISRDSGEDVRVLSRELSENGKKEHRRLKQAFYTLYEASGGKLQMVVVEENKVFSGAYPRGNTIYISADAIENGTWTRALAEESTHFAQGTPEHSLLYAFLADDAELLAKVENELTKEGNSYKFTSIDAAVFRDYIDGKIEEDLTGRALRYGNEVTAHMSAELLSNEAVIDRMISRHATLAERIMIKIRQIKRALSRIKDAKAKAQFERLTTAEQIYLAAIERRGWRFDGNKIIMGADDEELDNEEEIDYNRKRRDPLINNVFPQEDISHSDASRWAINWVHKSSTKTGDRALATYHGRWYLIQKFDDADLGYRIIDRVYKREYEKIFEEVKRNGESRSIKSIQGKDVGVDQSDRQGNTDERREQGVDRAPTGYGSETDRVVRLGGLEVERGERTGRDGGRDRESGRPDQSGRDAGVIDTQTKEDSQITEEDKTYFRTKEQTAVDNKNTTDANENTRTDNENSKNANDFTDLLASAGIEGEAAEIRGDLVDLYEWIEQYQTEPYEKAKDAKQAERMIKRMAKRVATNMALKGVAQNGETQEAMAERLYNEILDRADFDEPTKAPNAKSDTAAEQQGEKETQSNAENEPKPKKTGYTYDDVNSMLDDIRKSSLSFETASGAVEGQLFRNDRWELGKRIYNTLKMDELGSKRELSRKIASLIVDAAKINEKGADGKTVQRRLADVLGKDGVADAKDAVAIDVAAALGDRDAKKYNKRMNDLKYAAQQLSDMKKGKYVNAANYKGDTFKVALSELARMNWRGGLVSAKKLREHFAALSRWYTPSNPLYGNGGEANENYRRSIAEALDFVSDTSRGTFTLEDIDAAEMIVKYFKREIENYGTIFKNGKRVQAEPLVKSYIAKIDQAKEIAEKSGIVRGILRNRLARLAADPAMLMREADGYLPGGFFSEQFAELRRGTIDAAVLEHEMLADFVAFWEKNKAYAKRYNGTEVKYGDKVIPLQEAIMLYMTMKREHAFAGLAYAGFEIEGKDATVNVSDGFSELVEKAKVELMSKVPPEKALTMTQDEVNKVQEKAIEQAVGQMREELYRQFTAEDKRLITIMERGYEACREVKIEKDNILMGDSNVVGGYYCPVRRAGLAENVDIMSMFEGDRVTNLSFNKDTVKNAHKLLIEPAHIVFMRHVKAMSLYHGLGIFTDNFNRLYNLNVGESANNPITIRQRIAGASKFAKDMMDYFKELKQDVEGISKKRSSEKFYNDAAAMIRSAYATYQLGFNPKTWASQFSSLIASAVKLDPAYLMYGFTVSGKDVDDYCRLAWLRNNDGDAVLAQSVTSGMNPVQMASRNALQKVRDVSMWPIGKVDRLVIERLFAACQVQVAKKQGLKLGSNENKVAAGQLLETVILETQQNSLATERTAAMRSGDELLKGFNMFLADAMKVGARFIEPYAKMSALRTQKRMARDAGNTDEIARLDKKIEAARKECVRATSVMVGVALFNALLAYGFKWLYRRDEEEDVGTVTADFVGNMLGGIPFVRDAYTFLVDGFEADNFAISTFNDVLQTVADTAQLLQDAADGKEISRQDTLRAVRGVLYTVGQLSGVSTRNLYNNITGIINRVSPEVGYQIESALYKPSYAKDLQAAIEADDDRMVSLIASMMIDERVGDADPVLVKGLQSLVEGGYDVLPRMLGDNIVYDGEEIELTRRQKTRFRKVYAIAEEQIVAMMKLSQYKEADDEVRARAIKMIWNVYYDLAVDDVLGVDSAEKNVLFAEAIDMAKLALVVATARGIKADVDASGKVINGSRLAKIEKYVAKLNLRAAQKYMIMGYLGYVNTKGEDVVRSYINSIAALSREEKRALLAYSGYNAA